MSVIFIFVLKALSFGSARTWNCCCCRDSLCLMQVEQGLPVTTSVATYTRIWDYKAQLQEVTGGCVVRGHEGTVGRSSAGAKAGRGCTLVKLGWGGLMCLYLKSVYLEMLLSSRILKTADNKWWVPCVAVMVIKMQRGSCLDLPCQTSPEYLCAIEINDLFNLGIPGWPHVSFALSKVFFVFCRCRNL